MGVGCMSARGRADSAAATTRERTTTTTTTTTGGGGLHDRLEELVFPGEEPARRREGADAGADGGGARRRGARGGGGGGGGAEGAREAEDGIGAARSRLRRRIDSGTLALEVRERCEALLRAQLNPTRVTKEQVLAELVEFAYARVSPAVRAETARAVTEALLASVPELRAGEEREAGAGTEARARGRRGAAAARR